MNVLSDKVIMTKNALMSALGDNAPRYLNNMKLWFRHKITKDEFDIESRKILTNDKVYLHNRFFLAILEKVDTCQPQTSLPIQNTNDLHQSLLTGNNGNAATANNNSSSNRSRKRKRSSRGHADRLIFEPYDVLDFIPEDNLECIRPAVGTDANVQILPTQRYCAQELFLPDAAFVMGRFLIGAWETGLVNVEEGVAEYVSVAVQVLLKNLISTIIMKRKHYKVTGEGSYFYDVGAQLKDIRARNTVTRQKVDDAPLELDKEITSPNVLRRSNEDNIFLSACEEIYTNTKKLFTLEDAQNALRDRNLIKSHTVYAMSMERLTQMMNC